MPAAVRGLGSEAFWHIALALSFVAGSAWWALIVIIEPLGLGSHANIYTAAAAAWLQGGDPWSVGPPEAIFAGPPPMLLAFVPFVILPPDLTRLTWFAIDLLVAAWALRSLKLPAYWLAFPPLFEAIVLGHPEVLVLGLLVIRGPASGLAMLVKPYAVFPLAADRRWSAIGVGAAALAVGLAFLPWQQFLAEGPLILGNLARQNVGDSVFGDPLLVVVGAAALATLGLRRALWLGVPLLWPYAQPLYKTMTIPMLSPLLAFAWALPFHGATMAGILAIATLEVVARRRALPRLLQVGIDPCATTIASADGRRREMHQPQPMAA